MSPRMGRPKNPENNDLPPRMSRRVMKNGTVHYYYRTADDKKIPLGSDFPEAKRKWADLEHSGAIAADDQFTSVSARFRNEYVPTKAAKTQTEYLAALDRLDTAFGKFRLPQIKPSHCRQYLDRRTAKVMANREMAVFSAMFNWARERGITDAENPKRGVKRNPEKPREIYVRDEELRAVADQDQILADALDLIYLTGQRPADVLKAKRTDLEERTVLENGKPVVIRELLVKQGKTGAFVRIEIVGELADVINRCLTRTRAATGAYLVQTNEGQRLTRAMLRKRFEKARKEAGQAWQVRDLRGKAATDMDDLKSATLLLGHADEATTAKIYRRLKGNKAQPVNARKVVPKSENDH